tara:strand:- start:149 stop:550 length:402 start_codon:yes stop_codon:yes gene_type:complete
MQLHILAYDAKAEYNSVLLNVMDNPDNPDGKQVPQPIEDMTEDEFDTQVDSAYKLNFFCSAEDREETIQQIIAFREKYHFQGDIPTIRDFSECFRKVRGKKKKVPNGSWQVTLYKAKPKNDKAGIWAKLRVQR